MLITTFILNIIEIKGEGYHTISNEDSTIFFFESIGLKGTISKVIIFFHLGKNIWNMGFGDGDSPDFDDEVISNNHDVQRVLQTIANTIHQFLEAYPDRSVFIRPVDEKRKRLYNSIFKRREAEIYAKFFVQGSHKGLFVDYDSNKIFDNFLISLKKQ